MGQTHWQRAIDQTDGKLKAMQDQELIVGAGHRLDEFLASPEGITATELLRVTGEQIVLSETQDEGTGYKHFLDGTGLHRLTTLVSWSAAFTPDPDGASTTSATAFDVAQSVFRSKGFSDPDYLIGIVKQRLDEVATKAQKTT